MDSDNRLAAIKGEQFTQAERRSGKVLLVTVALILGILGYFLVFPMVIHDYQLWRSSSALDSLSHPPDTARVKKYSQVGLLFGNGNHTDFWIKEIRSFKGDFLSIQKHYEKQEVIFPHGCQ